MFLIMQVCINGALVVDFSLEDKPRILSWYFNISDHVEFIPRGNSASQALGIKVYINVLLDRRNGQTYLTLCNCHRPHHVSCGRCKIWSFVLAVPWLYELLCGGTSDKEEVKARTWHNRAYALPCSGILFRPYSRVPATWHACWMYCIASAWKRGLSRETVGS